MSSPNGQKRGRYPSSAASRNPPRGAPGILFTAETGRETKCRREGLELLQYDWDTNTVVTPSPSSSASKDDANKDAVAVKSTSSAQALTLDQELEAMKNKTQQVKSPFAAYETGCRGTVFVLCIGGRRMIRPLEKKTDETASSENLSAVNTDKDDLSAEAAPEKKAKVERSEPSASASETSKSDQDKSVRTTTSIVADASSASETTTPRPVWNPMQVVQRVVEDMKTSKKSPSSRFITRMIPIQATCFTSLHEITQVVRQLLLQAKTEATTDTTNTEEQSSAGGTIATPKTTSSFGIQFKKRNCSHLQRDDVIREVGSIFTEIVPSWTVNLNDPDYTVVIEVCKNVVGISIVKREDMPAKNFNLAEVRDSVAAKNSESSR